MPSNQLNFYKWFFFFHLWCLKLAIFQMDLLSIGHYVYIVLLCKLPLTASRSHFFYNDESRNGKNIYSQMWKDFDIWWKKRCNLLGANLIKINLQTCKLCTGQSLHCNPLQGNYRVELLHRETPAGWRNLVDMTGWFLVDIWGEF